MKHQLPTSKFQRSSKDQAPKASSVLTYSGIQSGAWVLNDETKTKGGERHAFDLEERTAKFGETIIRFCKIPRVAESIRLIDQLVGCGTSVGANYCEANEGVSKKDFKCSVGRCVKEAKETKFFLRMVAASEPTLAEEARVLYHEAKELHLIFASMYRK